MAGSQGDGFDEEHGFQVARRRRLKGAALLLLCIIIACAIVFAATLAFGQQAASPGPRLRSIVLSMQAAAKGDPAAERLAETFRTNVIAVRPLNEDGSKAQIAFEPYVAASDKLATFFFVPKPGPGLFYEPKAKAFFFNEPAKWQAWFLGVFVLFHACHRDQHTSGRSPVFFRQDAHLAIDERAYDLAVSALVRLTRGKVGEVIAAVAKDDRLSTRDPLADLRTVTAAGLYRLRASLPDAPAGTEEQMARDRLLVVGFVLSQRETQSERLEALRWLKLRYARRQAPMP